MAKWLVQHGHTAHVLCIESVNSGTGDGLRFIDDVYDQIPVRRLYFNLDHTPDPFHWSYFNPEIGDHLEIWLPTIKPDIVHLISGYVVTASAITIAKQLGFPLIVTLMDFWFLCRRITLVRSDGRLCGGPTPLNCAICLYNECRRYGIPYRILPDVMERCWHWVLRHPIVSNLIGFSETMKAFRKRQDVLEAALKRADILICHSRFLRNRFIAEGLDPEKMIFVRQGLPSEVKGKDDPDRINVTPYLRFGYLGQLEEHKGVHILVDAFQKLVPSDYHPRLTLYGNLDKNTRYAKTLHHMARRNSHIVFAGEYRTDQIAHVLAEVDVVIVPSTWYENSPNIILEALANRTPVVTSALGGMAEMVQHNVNGLLCQVGHSGDLSSNLQRLIDEPGLLERLRRGIAPVKTLDKEMHEVMAVYRSVGHAEN
jgi:glycosyltransferase involved in cell wall biosynthesis